MEDKLGVLSTTNSYTLHRMKEGSICSDERKSLKISHLKYLLNPKLLLLYFNASRAHILSFCFQPLIPLAPTSSISLSWNFMMFYCKEISRNKIFKNLYCCSIADVEVRKLFIFSLSALQDLTVNKQTKNKSLTQY